MAFNSPVWFNVGITDIPQCSACFILNIEDSIDGIMKAATTEALIFKGGGGSGINVSSLRSSREHLSGGGTASGPVSFMKGLDAFAGVIKSGGQTRRAAKMVILNDSHPDIMGFIWAKAKEERKAHALIREGYDPSFTGEAYSSIQYQNANNSVRVTDEFMKAVENDGNWELRGVKENKVIDTVKAKDVLRAIAEATHECGDPGIQMDTIINKWHTCPNSGRINASNPCSEFMFLDNTSCNLASLNLMKFRTESGEFNVEAFKHAARVLITAMEILVDYSSYPIQEVVKNSHDFRPLGIGYCNLGALLMSRGLAYDSDEGRNFAAAITSLLSGHTYYQSAKIAEKMGAFNGYEKNKEPFLKVIKMHKDAAYNIPEKGIPEDLLKASKESWDNALEQGEKHGYRNSQVSVLAPTGTIGFLMDCDTTGIEPAIALVSYKWMVDGGMVKIVNRIVPQGLIRLGYNEEQVKEIMDYIDKNDTIEGSSLKEEHLPVFDCAFKPKNGKRTIHHMGHIKMMSSTQPFLSGAISKTVNMPQEATVEEIEDAYMQAWKLGVKAIAIYRDGSKGQQVVTTEKSISKTKAKIVSEWPKKLPTERKSLTHKFNVANHTGFITVGLFPDGKPGEIFITMSKEGSTMGGLMDSFAISTSLALQHGTPLEELCELFIHMRYEPSGVTNNPHIRMAKSITDYIFRWLALRFLEEESQQRLGVQGAFDEPIDYDQQKSMKDYFKTAATEALEVPTPKEFEAIKNSKAAFKMDKDAPFCHNCGGIMIRNGSCYKCLNCGETTGCS